MWNNFFSGQKLLNAGSTDVAYPYIKQISEHNNISHCSTTSVEASSTFAKQAEDPRFDPRRKQNHLRSQQEAHPHVKIYQINYAELPAAMPLVTR